MKEIQNRLSEQHCQTEAEDQPRNDEEGTSSVAVGRATGDDDRDDRDNAR